MWTEGHMYSWEPGRSLAFADQRGARSSICSLLPFRRMFLVARRVDRA